MEHILITDDNSEYRAEIIELLEGEGYTLTGAANGEEALAKITANPPDLILCDIDMPVIDGLEVLRRVRATPATAHIPFIIISGRTDDASLKTATELGVTDYITKPMNIDHLLTKIQQCSTRRSNTMRIAVLANLMKNAPTWEGMSPDQWDDLDGEKTIKSIIAALESGGHSAEFFEASLQPPFNLVEKLRDYQPDLCFNIAEGHFGDGRESHIPSILEMLRIPYTGSKVTTLALTLDKPLTKRVLRYHNLPTPEFQVFETPDDPIDADLLNADGELAFPLFVKPSREGTGMGVSAASIVRTVAELHAQVDVQMQRYNQPILCERYIAGRELTVGVIGNLRPTAARRLNERTAPNVLPDSLTFFPIMEVDLEKYEESEAGLYTNRIKTDLVDDFHFTIPAPLPDEVTQQLFLLTAAVFRVTGCKDVARVDFRLDEDGQAWILEVNPLPGLNPGYSDLCLQAKAHGWTYEHLLNTIVALAAERQNVRVEA